MHRGSQSVLILKLKDSYRTSACWQLTSSVNIFSRSDDWSIHRFLSICDRIPVVSTSSATLPCSGSPPSVSCDYRPRESFDTLFFGMICISTWLFVIDLDLFFYQSRMIVLFNATQLISPSSAVHVRTSVIRTGVQKTSEQNCILSRSAIQRYMSHMLGSWVTSHKIHIIIQKLILHGLHWY